MRIDSFNIQKALEVYNKASVKVQKNEKAKAKQKRDDIILSDNAKSFSAILNKVKNEQGIRFEKVKQIKEKVDNGTYKIDNESIAAKIIEASIKNKQSY